MDSNILPIDNKNTIEQNNEFECDKAHNQTELPKEPQDKLKERQNDAESSSVGKQKDEMMEETEKEENGEQKSTEIECKQEDILDSSEEPDQEESLVEKLDNAPLYRDPTFAEICSFFNTFTPMFGFKPLSFSKLEDMFCTLVEGDATRELIDLHLMLMRKIYMKSARADKWEQSLLKFCSIAPGLDAEFRQLQRNTYGRISIGSKLAVLKALCDSQFDYNLKFKENIANTFRHNELRLAPIGIDKRGQLYYFQIDCDLEFRVYSEETEDMAGVSWSLRARTETELAELIEILQNPDYDVVTKEQQEEEEADIDEEQLLDQPKEAKKDAALTRSSSASSASKPFQPFLSEEERQKVQLEGKFSVLWDHFKKTEILNKRKNEKEKKQSQPTEVSSNAIQEKPKQEEGENGKTEEKVSTDGGEKSGERAEEEKQQNDEKEAQSSEKEEADKSQELDEAILAEIEAEEQRRILPRRSARNAALHNIKGFGGLPRRQMTNETTGEKRGSSSPINSKKLGFVPATAGSCTEEDSEDESEEDEEETGDDDSSDDDFLLDGEEKPKRKVGRPPTKRAKGGKMKGKKRAPGGKGGKKGTTRRLRLIGHPPPFHDCRSKMRKHHQQSMVISEDGESSEDGEETAELKKRRERKRATEQTFCQICKGSKNPDLLLLCDSCDTAWHTFCLRPQLWFVPDGDWFCPFCEHSALIRRLIYALIMLREEIKASEDKRKKKEAAERLKKEMDYIGISLNNIIPFALQRDGNGQAGQWSDSSAEQNTEDEGVEGERKSKKKAMKKVMSKTREKRRAEQFYGPIVTIAEGRSRRALTKVDYNFHAYDEQLQEAMETIDPDAKAENENDDSSAGRGKDMQNIYKAEKKHKQEEELNEGGRGEGAPARPPNSREDGRGVKKGGRKGKRLTDLDIGIASDSDTDEWKASSADEIEEDPEPSEDEYLPSERRSARGIGFQGRRKSDDEFINDESDSDYNPSRKKKAAVGKRSGTIGRTKKRRRQRSSSSEDDGNELQLSDSDSAAGPSSRKKPKPSKSQTHSRKWGPRASSSEEDEAEEEFEVERTETGRPLRKAAVNMRKKLKEELQYEEDEEEEEEEEEERAGTEEKEGKDEAAGAQMGRLADRAVSALARPQRMTGNRNGDGDEFKPDEDDEAEADEEEEEAEKEEEVEETDDEEKEESETSTDKDEEEEGERENDQLARTQFVKKGATPTDKKSKPKRTSVSRKGLSRNKPQSKNPKSAQTESKTEKEVQNSHDDMMTSDETEHQPQNQRQTRQQLRKQLPLIQENGENSINNLPSTSTNSNVQEETKKVSSPKENSDAVEATNELKQQPIQKEEAAVSEATAPVTATSSSLCQSEVPTIATTVTANPTAPPNAKIVANVGPVCSSRTATVFQQIHPQQLSQYFMRPALPNSHRQHEHHQSHTLSTSVPPVNRFQGELSVPTVSYAAYDVTHQPLRLGNVHAPPGLLSAHQFPVGSAIPFAMAHPPNQQATYFVQPSGAPQIIYQTLQPISSVTSQHSTTQQQSDSDGSLSHALAGAMNPEDL